MKRNRYLERPEDSLIGSFGIIYTNKRNVKHTSLEPDFTRYVAKVLLCDVLEIILLHRNFRHK